MSARARFAAGRASISFRFIGSDTGGPLPPIVARGGNVRQLGWGGVPPALAHGTAGASAGAGTITAARRDATSPESEWP